MIGESGTAKMCPSRLQPQAVVALESCLKHSISQVVDLLLFGLRLLTSQQSPGVGLYSYTCVRLTWQAVDGDVEWLLPVHHSKVLRAVQQVQTKQGWPVLEAQIDRLAWCLEPFAITCPKSA